MFRQPGSTRRFDIVNPIVRKGYQVGKIAMDTLLENALEAIDEVTSSANLWIEAPLSRGELQYLNNHELGHYRSDFVDQDDETKKDIFLDIGIELMAIKHTMVNFLENSLKTH